MTEFFLLVWLMAVFGFCFYALLMTNIPLSVWIFTKLRLKEGVVLEDDWGTTYYTWVVGEQRDLHWTKVKFAHVYPFSRIGFVQLNPDGSTEGQSIYIKRWKKL